MRRASTADLDAIVALQHSAYAINRVRLGVEPLPLQVDYADILRDYETWVWESEAGALQGVLILLPRAGDLLVWSVSTSPAAQGTGLGNRLLAFAEQRAHELGVTIIRLYTGQKLASNVEWYQRKGFVIERLEEMSDRTVVHMAKHLKAGE